MAWADQQCRAHHIEYQQELGGKCLQCTGPYSHLYAAAGSATQCWGTLVCNAEDLTIAAASRGGLNKSFSLFIHETHTDSLNINTSCYHKAADKD